MDSDVERELTALKRSVDEIGARLTRLERLSGSPAGSVPETVPPIAPPAVKAADPTPKSAAVEPVPLPAVAARQSLETRIGLYWLNRIGVGSLVIGVALLILYSFQYFGPLAKIAMGIAVSAALIGLGEWISGRRGLSWYGQGLMGGGWSLAYFTVYAMHFVPAVRVVASPLADAALLLAVAAGATVHAVWRKAEIIAVLAVVLGFATVPLARVEAVSPFASAVLAVVAAALSARLQWQRLYLWGLVSAYISAMAIDSHVNITGWSPLLRLQHSLSYFGVVWLANTAALFFFGGEEPVGRKRLVVGTIVNALAFFCAMYTPVEMLLRSNQYWFALALGSIYGVSASELKRRGLAAVATTHLIVGLTLVNAAVPMAFVPDWCICLWTMEVAALAYLGLEYRIAGLRWFSLGLSFAAGLGIFVDLFSGDTITFMGMFLPTRCLLTAIGAASFGLAASFHRRGRFADHQGPRERRWFYYLYFLGAALFAWLTPPLAFYHHIAGERWLPESTANGLLPAAWALEASAMILFGLLSASRFARVVGMLGLVVVGWSLLILHADWTWAGTLTIVACLYGLGHLYRRTNIALGAEAGLDTWYSLAASIITTLLIGNKAQSGWASPAWTLQGLLLLLAGFRLPDRWFRVSGLVVFALVMLKLLFVDLAGAATIQRILSFIGAGVVLLVASYAYGKYAVRLTSAGKGDGQGE